MKHVPSFDEAMCPNQDVKHAALSRHLSATLAALVPNGRSVVFWDYPVYANVGDIAIYLGTEAWLRQNAIRVLDRRTMENFRALTLEPETVILLQGGGNFGDLYSHQAFREKIVSAYPDNRIVFLPQTLHYLDTANRSDAATILNAHADLHLVLRDSYSYATAGDIFGNCHRYLAPDMTAALHPLSTFLGLGPDKRDELSGDLYLLRSDEESCQDYEHPRAIEGRVCDWDGMLGKARVSAIRQATRMHRYGQLTPASLLSMGWYQLSIRILRHCAEHIVAADRVLTDRLHGHILSTMMGVPNVVLDNSYGKNGRYFETWHGDIDIARFAGDGIDLGAKETSKA